MFYPQKLQFIRWQSSFNAGSFNKKFSSIGEKYLSITKRKMKDKKARKLSHSNRLTYCS